MRRDRGSGGDRAREEETLYLEDDITRFSANWVFMFGVSLENTMIYFFTHNYFSANSNLVLIFVHVNSQLLF